MKRWFLFCFAFCLLLSPSLKSQTTYRALFLGNSYTNYNNLPSLVRNLALSGGDTLITDANTPGGFTLQGHSTNSTSLGKIAQGGWDFVVMQEQSQRPSFSPGQVAQEVFPYAAILVDSIRAANPCAEPTFYMTWGRKNGDQSNCAVYPPICTYEGMQTRLKSSYVQMAVDNECTVSPVGMAFWLTKIQDPNLELYNPDQSHPSYAGSYLAACVFYSTFFRKSPAGLPYYGNLDSTTATFLQQIADEVVLDSLSQWRIGANDVAANFNFNVANDEVTFTDASDNATSWSWDFGDGNVSTLEDPIHTYDSSGTYTVTLIVTNGCQSDTITESISLTIVGLEAGLSANLELYPNPTRDQLQLRSTWSQAQELQLHIWNLQGAVLGTYQVGVTAGEQSIQLELPDLSPGIYLLKIQGQEGEITRRFQVQ